MLAYHAADADACAARIGEAWKVLWASMEASDASIRKAAAQALDRLVKCFTPSFISSAVKERKSDDKKAPLSKIISQTGKALGALTYARALAEVMTVIASLIAGLRSRGPTVASTGPTAAELLLLPTVTKIAELRVQKSFEFKEAADRTLSTAMQVLGPEVLLRELPLNLEPSDRYVLSLHAESRFNNYSLRKTGKEPRAFLLPMLNQPHCSPLSHFVTYFVPLTERMFDLQQTAESEGRQSEAKVWSVLVDQIWSGLHGYCYGCPDLNTVYFILFITYSSLIYASIDVNTAIFSTSFAVAV